MTSPLSVDSVRAALAAASLSREVEFYPVALTATSAALAWLRQRDAPHGSLVVAETEVAPRARLGEELTFAPALAFSMVVRPAIAVDHQDVLWAVGSLALAATASDEGTSARWPDLVTDKEKPLGSVTVETQLSPGRVESSILTFRLASVDSQLERMVQTVEAVESLVQRTPAELADRYREICAFLGRAVTLRLMPTGSTGGTAQSIDERGGFVVGSSAGSRASYPIDQIRKIELR